MQGHDCHDVCLTALKSFRIQRLGKARGKTLGVPIGVPIGSPSYPANSIPFYAKRALCHVTNMWPEGTVGCSELLAYLAWHRHWNQPPHCKPKLSNIVEEELSII